MMMMMMMMMMTMDMETGMGKGPGGKVGEEVSRATPTSTSIEHNDQVMNARRQYVR